MGIQEPAGLESPIGTGKMKRKKQLPLIFIFLKKLRDLYFQWPPSNKTQLMEQTILVLKTAN